MNQRFPKLQRWMWATLSALIGALLSACATAPVLTPRESPAQELLLRYLQTQHLEPSARLESAAALRARVATEPSLANRIELALLTTLPDASSADRSAARELLLPCAGDPATDPLVGLCVLTGRMLANDAELQAKLSTAESALQTAAATSALQQQQRDALTSQAAAKQDAESRRIASLERQLGEQHKHIDALRRQMRELQAIERSIEDRHGNVGSP